MRSAVTVPVACLLCCSLLSACGSSGDSDKQTADLIREQAEQRERERDAALKRAREREREQQKDRLTTSATGAGAGRQGFDRVDSALPGRQGVAFAPAAGTTVGQVTELGDLQSGTAWSTAKVPVAMAAVAAGKAPEGQLRSAITASDNAAAESLWSALGSGRTAAGSADRQLRLAGDSGTSIQPQRLLNGFTAFGQTDWSLAQQVRFVSGMQCSSQGRRVLELMGQVISEQRWGLANVGSTPRFKGGWGPGTTPGAQGPWMERQMGLVKASDGSLYAVAIASEGGDHQSAINALNRLAAYVKSALPHSGGVSGC